jgi:Txe/YoeB family toxin of toxin-antitoxin system
VVKSPPWKLRYTKQALKYAKKLSSAGLKQQTTSLLAILKQNPFTNPPPYKKLTGDLKGSYSRRITIQHRLVYQVFSEEHTVKIIQMWSHYGD